MITAELAQSASRLLEALEKLGQSSGSDLQSGGPSGKPSQELIEEFQDALNAVSSATPINSASPSGGPEAISGPTVELSTNPLLPGPAESMPPVSTAENATHVTASPSTTIPANTPANVPEGVEEPEAVHAAETPDSPGRMNSQAVNEAIQPDFFMEFRAMPTDASVNQTGLSHADTFGKGFGGTENVSAAGENITRLNSVEEPGEAGGPAGAADKASGTPDDTIKELGQLLEQVSQPGVAMTPVDVYRLQYLLGMLKIQAQTGLKASQNTTQGLESVLRQSG